MSEHLFEYMAIIILLLIFSIYLMRHQIIAYFMPKPPHISQAKLAIKVKNGYRNLIHLVYHNSIIDKLEEEINSISKRFSDGRYIDGYRDNVFDKETFILDYFYEILNYSDRKNESFIFTLNSNSSIEEFVSRLKELFPNIKLPILSNIDLVDMLLSYKEKLNAHNIQMTFISDDSDSYYFLLHPLEKEKEVIEAIKFIGLNRVLLNI